MVFKSNTALLCILHLGLLLFFIVGCTNNDDPNTQNTIDNIESKLDRDIPKGFLVDSVQVKLAESDPNWLIIFIHHGVPENFLRYYQAYYSLFLHRNSTLFGDFERVYFEFVYSDDPKETDILTYDQDALEEVGKVFKDSDTYQQLADYVFENTNHWDLSFYDFYLDMYDTVLNTPEYNFNPDLMFWDLVEGVSNHCDGIVSDSTYYQHLEVLLVTIQDNNINHPIVVYGDTIIINTDPVEYALEFCGYRSKAIHRLEE